MDWSNPRAGIAVAIIICYSLFFIFSVLHIYRFGRKNTSGWIIIVIFTVIRIAAGAVDLVLYSNSTPSIGVVAAESALISAALGPLLRALISFVQKVMVANEEYTGIKVLPKHMRLFYLLIIVAILLAIVGSALLPSDTNSTTGANLIQACMIILLVILLISYGMALLLTIKLKHHTEASSKPYLHGSLLAGPFLVVRLSYSIGSAFNITNPDNKFNFLFGNWVMYLIMLFFMEVIVVSIYCVFGYIAETQDRRRRQALELGPQSRTEIGTSDKNVANFDEVKNSSTSEV